MRASPVAALAAALAVAGCTARPAPPPAPWRAWRVAYTGYGRVSASGPPAAVRLTLAPARPTSRADTHAALVLSRRGWHDLAATVRVRTDRQFRRPRPHPWEVGWLLWHYTGDRRFYYLALKPNGWELGKEDPAYPGGQRFLATGSRPAFPPGRWFTIGVRQRGGAIAVTVDGHRLVRYTDTRDPYLGGQVGLYSEEASATFQPVAIEALR
jgi:hypothetical protein